MHGEWYLSSWGYPFRDVRSLIKPQMTWVKNSSKGSKAKAIWFRRTKVAQRPNLQIIPPHPLARCRCQVRNSFGSGLSGFSVFNRAHGPLIAYFLLALLRLLLDALFLRTENLVQKNLKLVP